jgi:tetratricopeptide (TPR) repeat protein
MNPRDVDGWINLAVAQFTRGHYTEGITSCMTALAKDPENVKAMYNLGLAHERLGQHKPALVWVRRALARDPGDIAIQRLEFRLRIIALKRRLESAVKRYTHWLPR